MDWVSVLVEINTHRLLKDVLINSFCCGIVSSSQNFLLCFVFVNAVTAVEVTECPLRNGKINMDMLVKPMWKNVLAKSKDMCLPRKVE
jgi:hypothetical protein